MRARAWVMSLVLLGAGSLRAELPAKLSVILLAVKPQIVDAVAPLPVVEKPDGLWWMDPNARDRRLYVYKDRGITAELIARAEIVDRDAVADLAQLGGLGLEHFERVRGLTARYDERTRLDDARLGGRNLGDGAAEALGVIHRDWREHGYVTVGNVSRIPLATHAHFEHEHVYGSIGEDRETEYCESFEEGQLGVALCLELCIDDLD